MGYVWDRVSGRPNGWYGRPNGWVSREQDDFSDIEVVERGSEGHCVSIVRTSARGVVHWTNLRWGRVGSNVRDTEYLVPKNCHCILQ